jgi:hypothetical protein
MIEVRRKVSAAGFGVKAADSLGQASAIIATYGIPDLDRDVVVPGAIPDGTQVPVSPYNHSSLQGVALPVGLATVRTEGNQAIADLVFNMETAAGRDVWSMIKQLGPVMEYSWGFRVTDSERGADESGPVTYLKAVDLIEVSPVIRGASINTGTIPGSVKESMLREFLRYVRGLHCPDPVPAAARELVATERLRFERERSRALGVI